MVGTQANGILAGRHIAMDARPLSMPHTGVALYIKSIIAALQDQGAQITLVSNAPLSKPGDWSSKCDLIIAKGTGRFLWEQFALLKVLWSHDFDGYFCGWNYGLPAFYFGRTKLILSVLDLIPLNYPSVYLRRLKDRLEYKASLNISVHKATSLLTISKASADDFVKKFPGRSILPVHIKMLPPQVVETSKDYGDYFCYLGGVDHRKNIDKIIEAFAIYCQANKLTRLILIGKGFEQFKDQVDKLAIGDKVIFTGYITDGEKYRILKDSKALVYPSQAEGFGLPLVEAVLVGTPSITGNSSTLREVGGDTALYVDPQSPIEISEAMQKMDDPEIHTALKGACAGRAEHFYDVKLDSIIAEEFSKALKA